SLTFSTSRRKSSPSHSCCPFGSGMSGIPCGGGTASGPLCPPRRLGGVFGTPLPALTSTRWLLVQALSHVHFRARQLCRPQEFRNLTLGEPSCQRYASEINPGPLR